MLRWHLCHNVRTIVCKTDLNSRLLSGFSARAVFFSTDPKHDFLVLKPRKTHTVGVCGDVNIVPYFCGIWIDHVPLCTHIYLFFLFQSGVREADVLLTGKKIICGEERRGEVEGKKIYEYANLVTVWNLVMSGKCCRHLSLCRGHCLMPGSWAQLLLCATPPPPTSAVISQQLEPNYNLARSYEEVTNTQEHPVPQIFFNKTPEYCCCSSKTAEFLGICHAL